MKNNTHFTHKCDHTYEKISIYRRVCHHDQLGFIRSVFPYTIIIKLKKSIGNVLLFRHTLQFSLHTMTHAHTHTRGTHTDIRGIASCHSRTARKKANKSYID